MAKKQKTRSSIERIKKATRLVKPLGILAAYVYPIVKLLWLLCKFIGHR